MAVTQAGIYAASLMATISYFDEGDPNNQKADMAKALASLTDPSVNGPWKLVWGPADNDGILSFVARAGDGSYALAIRGTLTTSSAEGFAANLWDDAEVAQVPFLYPQSAGANIAAGSNDALALLIASTDPATDIGLLDYLRSVAYAKGNAISLVVVGHSLGGDIANLASLWLADQLGKVKPIQHAITPYTLAAPTTGDQAFANLWNATFGSDSYALVNTWDIIPMAWNKLAALLKTYVPQGGPSLYKDDYYYVYLPVELIQQYIIAENYTFVPVSPSTYDTFPGIAFLQGSHWDTEAARQHSLLGAYNAYIWLGLANPPAVITEARERPRVAQRRPRPAASSAAEAPAR
jgi:hypothetical protein